MQAQVIIHQAEAAVLADHLALHHAQVVDQHLGQDLDNVWNKMNN